MDLTQEDSVRRQGEVEEEELVSPPLEVPDAFPAEAAEKQLQFCFKLTNGYVEPDELPPPLASSGSMGDLSQSAAAAARRRRGFYFHNRNMTESIWMFGNQVTRLIDELPNAYAAHGKNDYSYRFELAKSKNQLLTLEVTLFNGRTFLFLKKYYKPRLPSGEIDETSDWTPTPSVISLDPQKDNPQALLKFALSAHRRLRFSSSVLNH